MTDHDWKQAHANAADKAWTHPIVQDCLYEARLNLHIRDGSLENTALLKIAAYAAQVARAQALGFDPELLRLSRDEANAELMDFAARLVYAGVNTTVINTPEEQK